MMCNSQKSDKLGFSSMWIENSQTYTFGLEKTKEREIKLPTFTGSQRKQGYSRKTSTSASLTTDMPLTVWITTNCGKFKRWESQTTWPALWEIYIQVKKQQLEPYKEQLTGLKLGKEYNKAVYCHPVYLTSMQTTSCKMPGWRITSWNQDYWENYQQPQICRWDHPNGRKWRGTKDFASWEWKKRVKKLVWH